MKKDLKNIKIIGKIIDDDILGNIVIFMRPIPKKIRELITLDKFFNSCCLCNSKQIQIHHNLIFKGRQVDDIETLLPLCPKCHISANNKDIKEQLDFIMLKRMSHEQILKYSKAIDYNQRLLYLINKFNE